MMASNKITGFPSAGRAKEETIFPAIYDLRREKKEMPTISQAYASSSLELDQTNSNLKIVSVWE